jgi:hypothetical protein
MTLSKPGLLLNLALESRVVHEPERQKEDRNAGHLGDNLGYIEVGNALPQNIVGQIYLGEPGILRLDGFKEAPASFGPFSVNP